MNELREPTGGPEAPETAKPAEPRLHDVSLWSNTLSVLGFYIVGMSTLLMVTFFLFQFFRPSANPYVDIIGYMVLPGIFTLGLVIAPIGAVIKYFRLKARLGPHHGTLHLPHLDLNQRKTRGALVGFLLFSFFVVLPLLAISSYQGYHYTESTEFCAKVCHSVMEPEAVAHAQSPHARVACAECHIGSGADWFVKSKLSGVRQVFAVWFDTYPRPIPPAIQELRPARETCEECHWPAKFFGSQYKEVVHYSPDESNTRRVVRMLLKTGGADESIGRVEGIHMHMVLNAQIEYIATDEALQEIPWVRYIRDDGSEEIFRSDGKGSADPPPVGTRRVVDCMDCHNRGAHHFRTPQQAVDLFLEVDRIDRELPFIKREAVDVLTQTYADRDTAIESIAGRLKDFYRNEYPEVWEQRRATIEQAVAVVQDIYHRNFFPEMKATWATYPENIGHLYSPGCFRCHTGRHVNDEGQAISSDCNVCHTFLIPAGDASGAVVEGVFTHSMQMVKHESLRCDQCHTGGKLLLCRECHSSGQWLQERAARY